MKNFGVLYENAAEETPVRMSPMFDIVSIQQHIRSDTMALTLNGTKLLASWDNGVNVSLRQGEHRSPL